jgi:outer membrane protein assembly factor BamE (lipoprotein component of BamABCDE complex)
MGVEMRIIVIALVFCLMGCASSGRFTESTSIRNETAASIASKIKRGTTTKEEVVWAIGPPESSSMTASGNEQWIYNLAEGKSAFDINARIKGVERQIKSMVVLFNKRGIVINYTFNEYSQ